MRLHLIFLSIACFLAVELAAQDVHFSQIEFTPLAINPALAGANSTMQGVVSYRSQWNSVAQPFQTSAGSFDVLLNRDAKKRKGNFGLGIFFFNDQAGAPKITTNVVNLNLSYHLIVKKYSTFGLGIYTGFGQRAIAGTADGKWATQFDGTVYNAGLASGEPINSPNYSFVDAGAGFLYTYANTNGYMTQNKSRKLNVGFAVFHLNRPNNSFVSDNGLERLNMRFSTFINGELGLENSNSGLVPGVYYQNQGNANELLLGTYYKYVFKSGAIYTGKSKPVAVAIGLFTRVRDAVIPRVLIDWDKYSLGFSYDINTSGLSSISASRGGFELFLRYNVLQKR
jgi:type IX secretion system PorP/SprF family membrane protein